jgi:hypothetical protein
MIYLLTMLLPVNDAASTIQAQTAQLHRNKPSTEGAQSVKIGSISHEH